MRYIIIQKDNSVYATKWYEYENHYNETMSHIIDLHTGKFSCDGLTWFPINQDHL